MREDITLIAPAKINLHLHILGKTENGFHRLDSLVCFTEFGDQISISPAENFKLEISGPFAKDIENENPAENLISKALYALSRETGKIFPYHISLQKNIPIGGGLGGGSSDAATLLKKISELENINFPLEKITSSLGSDITACLKAPSPLIMRGTGNDILSSAPLLPASCPIVLVNPRKNCPTPAVYKNLSMDRFSESVTWPAQFETAKDLAGFLKANTRNDLTPPAIKTETLISDVLAELEKQPDCLLARLSGSGATGFGLFQTEKDARKAAAQIKTTHPEWWVVETKTL